MRVCFKQSASRSWEIELDGVSLNTWEIYSDSDQAKTEYDKLSRELMTELMNRGPQPTEKPFSILSLGMEGGGWGAPMVVTVHRLYREPSEAKRGYDELVLEKLSDGYAQQTEVLGTKEKREALLEKVAINRAETTHRLPDVFSKLDLNKNVDCSRPLTDAVKTVFGIPLTLGTSDEIFNPVQSLSYLGRAGSQLYWQSQNTPEHHLQNAAAWEGGAEDWFEDIGHCYGFDFVACGPDGCEIPLRGIVHAGSADSNDGTWGEVWHKETGERVANITSTGDCETTIEVVSNADLFQSQKIPILTMISDEEYDYDNDDPDIQEIWNRGFYLSAVRMKYANRLQLELIVGLAVKTFSAYINDAYSSK